MARRGVYKGSLDGSAPIYKVVPVNASQTILKGSIIVKSTGKASVAASAAAAGTVWGVANYDKTTGTTVTATDTVFADLNPNSIYSFPYVGTTKTSLTNSDIGTKFDVTNAYTVNLDDTTDGFLECVGFDNAKKTIDVVLKNHV